jgi:threonine dehydrogenase-like Zn-dependent dehydrogenase
MLDRLTHHCHIVDTGNQSWRFKQSSTKSKIAVEVATPAQLYSPAEIMMIDLDDNRLAVAKRYGATTTLNSKNSDVVEQVMKSTGGPGVDTAIEAVGIPATFELCQDIVAPGGTIAIVGVYGVNTHAAQYGAVKTN